VEQRLLGDMTGLRLAVCDYPSLCGPSFMIAVRACAVAGNLFRTWGMVGSVFGNASLL